MMFPADFGGIIADFTPQIRNPWGFVPLLIRWNTIAVFGLFTAFRASLQPESLAVTLIWNVFAKAGAARTPTTVSAARAGAKRRKRMWLSPWFRIGPLGGRTPI
jgi:hypothetical protein